MDDEKHCRVYKCQVLVIKQLWCRQHTKQKVKTLNPAVLALKALCCLKAGQLSLMFLQRMLELELHATLFLGDLADQLTFQVRVCLNHQRSRHLMVGMIPQGVPASQTNLQLQQLEGI